MTIHFSSVFEFIGWLVVLGIVGYIVACIAFMLWLWAINR